MPAVDQSGDVLAAPPSLAGAVTALACIEDFASIAAGVLHPVGSTFTESGVGLTVAGFITASGAIVDTGSVEKVNSSQAQASVPELSLSSASLRFVFSPPAQTVTFLYADIDGPPPGSRINLGVNGAFTHTNNFPDPAITAGTFPSLTELLKTSSGQTGAVTMTGSIGALRIGGENLRLDRVCFERASSITFAKSFTHTADALVPGSVFTYVLNLRQQNGSSSIPASINDPLPPNVSFIGPIQSTLDAAPLPPTSARFISNTVQWNGALPADGNFSLRFPVVVRACVGGDVTFTNTAIAQVQGQPRQAAVSATAACWTKPPVEIEKSALTKNEAGELVPQADARVLNDVPLLFRFVAHNTQNVPVVLDLRDPLPDGLVPDSQTPGDFSGDQSRNRPRATRILAAGQVVTLTLPTRVQSVCGREITNQAESEQNPLARGVSGAGGGLLRGEELGGTGILSDTNAVRLRVLCNDLGDAPDSLNHASAAMNAYPAQVASFPTVYGPVTKTNGPGPLHRAPRPFHLGALVSPEFDADIGPDADGRNNLNTRNAPLSANHDRDDDGVRPEQLSFASCAATTIPITVAIGPGAPAMLTATQGLGYLNVWVDGNADGDWADSATCTGTPGSTTQAHEHIVIDYPINVSALGPGLHRVLVPTQRVPWNAPNAAWLRVTLSDQPSVKNLGAHGDGRGPVTGFGTGETEDYLWRNPQSRGPDVQVTKRGAFKLAADGTPSVAWLIEYENVGDASTTDGLLTDDLSQAGPLPPTRVDLGRAAPPVISGSNYQFLLPTLAPGERGVIIIEQALDGRLQYTNHVTVTASADTFAGNNTAKAIVADVALRPPLIVSPGNGTTCEDTVVVTGRAEPGATVSIYLSGVVVATPVANADGVFSATIGPLSSGAYVLYAVATLGSKTSGVSDSHVFVVDTSLGWSPLSLRFIDSTGRVSIPRDSSGRTDEDGWRVHLLAGERYTVSVKLCCDSPAIAAAALSISGTSVGLTDPDLDDVYQGVFTNTLLPGDLSGVLLSVLCSSVGPSTGGGTALIDPDGVVYDILNGSLLSASQVTCLAQDDAPSGSVESFEVWPAQLYEKQINPQVVSDDAHFAFFTPAGTYRLDAQKAGYQRYLSPDLNVIADPVRFDVPMTPVQAAPRYTVTISANGYSPAVLRVPKGSVVAFVNVDGSPHSATAPKSAPLNGKLYNFDSGLLQPGDVYRFKFDNPATYAYSDYNSTANAIIIVDTPTMHLPVVMR